MRTWLIAVVLALLFHALLLTFGGIFFLKPEAGAGKAEVADVDLLSVASDPKPEEQVQEPPPEELKVQQQAPPVLREIREETPPPQAETTPGLDALSLSALESAHGRSRGSLPRGGRQVSRLPALLAQPRADPGA